MTSHDQFTQKIRFAEIVGAAPLTTTTTYAVDPGSPTRPSSLFIINFLLFSLVIHSNRLSWVRNGTAEPVKMLLHLRVATHLTFATAFIQNRCTQQAH